MAEATSRPRKRAERPDVAAKRAASHIAAPYRATIAKMNVVLSTLRGSAAHGGAAPDAVNEALHRAKSEAASFRRACKAAGAQITGHSTIADIDQALRQGRQ